ncbi:hypothetical protein ACEWPL_014255 [Roseovarius sp. S1116L3]|uniref:hypothetical protein n=1 Tax=Roseovarius roseus TaxID=3342636 RepID=UPI00372B245B
MAAFACFYNNPAGRGQGRLAITGPDIRTGLKQALAGYFNEAAELDYDPRGLLFNLETPVPGLAA